ncbi:hypothetical protein C0J52_03954 [Blattella germanica]|nr:hypothetical protein C0J52_03954 [Blattella germanica]
MFYFLLYSHEISNKTQSSSNTLFEVLIPLHFIITFTRIPVIRIFTFTCTGTAFEKCMVFCTIKCIANAAFLELATGSTQK